MERAKTAKIRDIMNTWTGESLPSSFQLTATDSSGTVTTIATAAQTAYVLKSMYGTMLYSGYPQFDTIDSLAQEFLVDWMYEVSIYEAMVSKWYAVMTEEYNPLHNYDRTEDHTDVLGEITHTKSHDQDKITISGGKTEVTYETATYESSPKQREKVTTERPNSGDEVHEFSGTMTDTDAQSDEHPTTKHIDVHGNIGVMSSQQMLIQELSVRQFNILKDFIALFLRNHCHSVGGVDYES